MRVDYNKVYACNGVILSKISKINPLTTSRKNCWRPISPTGKLKLKFETGMLSRNRIHKQIQAIHVEMVLFPEKQDIFGYARVQHMYMFSQFTLQCPIIWLHVYLSNDFKNGQISYGNLLDTSKLLYFFLIYKELTCWITRDPWAIQAK